MSQMPKTYVLPWGIPLYWRDEQSGELPRAVEAYIAFMGANGPALSKQQLELVIDYLRYFINAPCWAGFSKLAMLRVRATRLKTVDDVDKFIQAALNIGLDPF